MIDSKKIESLAEQITQLIPPGLKTAADNLEDKVKGLLQAKLSQLDMVSREEFDVQTQVLARTRAKLEALEKAVAELQSNLNPVSQEDSTH